MKLISFKGQHFLLSCIFLLPEAVLTLQSSACIIVVTWRKRIHIVGERQ